MAGQITRAFGEILDLNAQLYDLEVNLPVRIIADLLEADGTLHNTVELTHTSKGVFVETTETMPNFDTLLVKYYTYEMDGTTLHIDYSVVEDRFMLDTSSSTVTSTIVIGDSLEGIIGDNDEIVGSLPESDVEGIVVDDDVIEGIINDDDLLEGIANEC